MKMKILLAALSAASVVPAVPRAARTAAVDAEGVLRWTDDASEVALVGVNYYPPFTVDYEHLSLRGDDIRAVMREDVAHFRRLGIGCVRIHCFDREFSRPDGAFIVNDHVVLLDDLIDLCAANGIYMVLTPIAWWGGGYAKRTDGFSDRFTMQEMTSKHEAWAVQAKFLTAFANHVNTVTGRRYADDPAILAFECINEPVYPRSHPDAEVTAYVNALVDGLRASGTRKPIYYNSWKKRNAACGASRADGVTGSYYPTGLVAGHALVGSQLGRIAASTLQPDAALAKKSRLIYEFDAADTPGSYMYPALGKLFRAEGVQIAAMFQYDPMRLAPRNAGWQTHFLNLVYTPGKAISLAIMQEVFRHVPRGGTYTPNDAEIVFPPFRVNGLRDLSEFVTAEKYYYTNDPVTPPPDPSALRHVWGRGASSVAASSGNGAYFLDRAAPGVWRLQLYPSVFQTADPYSGRPVNKMVVLPEPPCVTLRLPGLGADWTATPAAEGRPPVTARQGSAVLAPGDWLVTARGRSPDAARTIDVPRFVAPPAEKPTTRLSVTVPRQWAAGKPLPFTATRVRADRVTACLTRGADGETRTFTVSNPPVIPADFLTEGAWMLSFAAEGPYGTVRLPNAESDDHTWSRASGPETPLLHEPVTVKTPASDAKDFCQGGRMPLKRVPALAEHAGALVLDIENRTPRETRVELGFQLPKGGFGAVVHLLPGRQTLTVTPNRILPLWGGPEKKRPWQDIRGLSVLTGAWLWPGEPVPATDLVIHRLSRVPMTSGYRIDVRRSADAWELFDAPLAARLKTTGGGSKRRALVRDEQGRPAAHLLVEGFDTRVDSTTLRQPTDLAAYRRVFPNATAGNTLVLHMRGLHPRTDKVEIALTLDNGQVWGTTVPLTDRWQDIRIPFSSLRYFRHWGLPPCPPGARPDRRRILSVGFCFGKWLFPETYKETHGLEISSVRAEERSSD